MFFKYSALIIATLFTMHVHAQNKDSKKDTAKKFMYVEQMPYSGYDYAQYLSENIHYPDSARAHNIEGRVVVKFIVNEDGSITDAVVTKSVSPEIDEEAVRVISKMPPWKPGKQNGKLVKVYFSSPITFKLEDPKR